jgi:hypothetical protein
VRDNVQWDSRLNKEIVMTAKSAFSAVGLAHKVCLSAEEQGYTPEMLNALAEHPNLFRQLLQVQNGHASFMVMDHIIDCDASPFMPDGWKVEEHQKGGQFKFDASQVQLFLAEGQKKGKVMEGNKLRKELAGKPVLNACVLDYLLAHPHLIPEEWKGKYVFFWGTIYRNSDGNLYVRYLYWYGDRWYWDYHWLDDDWTDYLPAVLRAS